MTIPTYKRTIFQRIAGKPQSGPPADPDCWSYANGRLFIDLTRARELVQPWGAINIDDPSLPVPVLVFQDGGGVFRAFCNLCGHGGRRLDPVPGTETLMCCSLGKSRYDYAGNVVDGASEKGVVMFDVATGPGRLIVTLHAPE
jgi:nitrite reductase/ring-hydroxylating ferredoxin subunit